MNFSQVVLGGDGGVDVSVFSIFAFNKHLLKYRRPLGPGGVLAPRALSSLEGCGVRSLTPKAGVSEGGDAGVEI